MNEGKKKVSLCILTILTIILIGVIVFLVLAIKNNNEQQNALVGQIENLTNQKNKIETEYAKLNQINQEEKAKAEEKSENLNEETEKIIKELLLKEMPAFSFIDSAKDKYKVTGKYIDRIEIYSEPYYATAVSINNADWYKNMMKNEENTESKKIAIGTVTFTTKFDKTIEKSDIIFAGGSKSQMPYQNYVTQEFLFSLYKSNSGEYKLELGTGW